MVVGLTSDDGTTAASLARQGIPVIDISVHQRGVIANHPDGRTAHTGFCPHSRDALEACVAPESPSRIASTTAILIALLYHNAVIGLLHQRGVDVAQLRQDICTQPQSQRLGQ